MTPIPVACDHYSVDVNAEFGVCVCGLPQLAHKRESTISPDKHRVQEQREKSETGRIYKEVERVDELRAQKSISSPVVVEAELRDKLGKREEIVKAGKVKYPEWTQKAAELIALFAEGDGLDELMDLAEQHEKRLLYTDYEDDVEDARRQLQEWVTTAREQISDLSNLELDERKLDEQLPQDHSLRELDASNNRLSRVPRLKGNNLRTLNLSHNLLQSVDEVCTLITLEYLDLSDNQLLALPSGVGSMVKLVTLSASRNQIKTLDNLTSCKSLAVLDVESNQLTSLPSEIGSMKLSVLNFSNNQVTSVANAKWVYQVADVSGSRNPIEDKEEQQALNEKTRFTDPEHVYSQLMPRKLGAHTGVKCVRLLRSSWLVGRSENLRKAEKDAAGDATARAEAHKKWVLPRRQECPEGAFIEVEELRRCVPSAAHDRIAVVSISYAWQTAKHPDPEVRILALPLGCSGLASDCSFANLLFAGPDSARDREGASHSPRGSETRTGFARRLG